MTWVKVPETYAAIERLKAERDALKAEVERLRERHEELEANEITLREMVDEARNDALEEAAKLCTDSWALCARLAADLSDDGKTKAARLHEAYAEAYSTAAGDVRALKSPQRPQDETLSKNNQFNPLREYPRWPGVDGGIE